MGNIIIDMIDAGAWTRWRSLRLAALAEAPEAFLSRLADWQDAGDTELRWRARLALPGSASLVATRRGADVGMASCVAIDGSSSVELTSMWVQPAARGTGAADSLVEAAVKWAVAERAAEITLGVMQNNPRAIRLYQRHGFALTDQPPTCHPDGRIEHYMFLPLG